MENILGTIQYQNKEIQVIQDDSQFKFDFYLKYEEDGLIIKIIQSTSEIIPNSKQIILCYIKQYYSLSGKLLNAVSIRVPLPQTTEFDKWLNFNLTDFSGTGSDFYFNSIMNGICIDVFQDKNMTPFDIYNNFSLSQPIIFNIEVSDKTLTCNITNIGDRQIPYFKIQNLTEWQTSNVFENLENGEYTVLVKSDIRLMESKKTAIINFLEVV